MTGKTSVKAPTTEQENIKNARKTLKVIQQAASDKENLVGRAQRTGKEIVSKHNLDSDVTESKKKKVAVSSKCVQTTSGLKIDANDLTSEAGPSEDYWETLAEKRRVALEETLEENQKLHEENESLKEENKVLNQLLNESKELIVILQNMLETDDNEENDESESSVNSC